MSNANFDRRQITAGLAAAVTLPLAGGLTLAPTTVRAQSTGLWGNLAELSEEAQKLGLSVPRMSLAPSAGGDTYAEQLPAVHRDRHLSRRQAPRRRTSVGLSQRPRGGADGSRRCGANRRRARTRARMGVVESGIGDRAAPRRPRQRVDD